MDRVAWTLLLLQFCYLTCSRATHYKIPNRCKRRIVIPKDWFEKWVMNNQRRWDCGPICGLVLDGASESGLERSAGEGHVLIVDLVPQIVTKFEEHLAPLN